MKHGRCAVVGRWWGPSCAYVNFFSRQQTASVACNQCVSESVYAARVALLFSAKMTERLEQRYYIKFCQKLGDSQVETVRKIQWVFGDDAKGITQIKEWYNRFKDGRTSMESDALSGRPSTSRNEDLIDQVRSLVMQDRRVTVQELAEEVGISTGSVHSILTDDLTMWRVSAKFVPKLLTMQQKQLRLEVSQYMLDYANRDLEFPNIVTTGDESWVYGYDLETKTQSSQWKHSTSPRPKKASQVRRNVKVMLTVSLTLVRWCITSTHHKAKTLTKNTVWKSFVAFAVLCGAREQTGGSSITTTHQLIPRN